MNNLTSPRHPIRPYEHMSIKHKQTGVEIENTVF